MKTSQRHFKIFKKECQRWIKGFNLSNWQVYFKHLKFRGEVKAFARLKSNLSSHTATIFLNKDWEKDLLTDERIKKSARHEVMHLLLARLGELSRSRYVTPTEFIEAEEEIVNRLVNYFRKNEKV